MTSLEDMKAAYVAARERGDEAEARRLLAAMRRLDEPENTLAPKTTETRD
jgi:hypothetical protein